MTARSRRLGGNPLLDLLEARHQRDEAVAHVDAHGPEAFKVAAEAAIAAVARRGQLFIVDDVWAELAARAPAIEKPVEARVMGAIMARARRAGIIEPTDQFRSSAQVQCHANPRRVWRPGVASRAPR